MNHFRLFLYCLLLLPSIIFAEKITIHFQVDMQDAISEGLFEPTTEQVGIRGSVAPLSWNKSLLLSDANNDFVYEITLTFEHDSFIAFLPYKIKLEGGNNPNGGWESGANRVIEVRRGNQQLYRTFNAPPEEIQPTFSGNIKIHQNFESKFLEPRNLYVYLPPQYSQNPEQSFPVLYMHDGQNIFDASEVGMEWRMDETASQLIATHQIEPIIIVGIGNTPNRIYEYTPTAFARTPESSLEGGGASVYARMILEEIKPFIDHEYRTLPDKAHTAVGGASLGGLVSLYLGLKHPEIFGKLLVVSPSIWWDDQHILQLVREQPKPAFQIWLDIGTDEGEIMMIGTRSLFGLLKEQGFSLGTALVYLEEKGAKHDEVAWARRVPQILKFLFGITSQTE